MAKPKTKPTSKFLLHPNMPETYLVPFTLVPWSLLGFPKKKAAPKFWPTFLPGAWYATPWPFAAPSAAIGPLPRHRRQHRLAS